MGGDHDAGHADRTRQAADQSGSAATILGGPIALLLTDVVTPHMPGHELATCARPSPGVTLLNKPVPEHLPLSTMRNTINRADTDRYE